MAEKWIQGILGYNYKNDRYGLLVTDLWEIDGFSCGNRLHPSPVGLRIFFLPTCVGLRYGHLRNTHSFSRHLPSQTSVLISLDLYRNQHPALRLQMCPCA